MNNRTKKYRRSKTRQNGGMNIIKYIKKTIKSIRKDKTPEQNDTKMNCNPAIEGKRANNSTCYTKDILIKIKSAYNKAHPENPIDANIDDTTKIVNELRKRLLPKCQKEDCWLKLLPKEQQNMLDKMVFAPDQPPEWKNNSNEWLSNYDIMNVLEQYEKANHPRFKFLGPTPIDFDKKLKDGKCVWEDICKFNLAHYKEKGVTDIAFIFNLDEHDESGSHWTSMYLSIPYKTIFYFDSALNDMPIEVQKLIERISMQSKEFGIQLISQKNIRQHQYGDSECGMYSLFFIITLLTEKCGGIGKKIKFKDAIKMFKCKHIPDKMVYEFRNKYFNKAGGSIDNDKLV